VNPLALIDIARRKLGLDRLAPESPIWERVMLRGLEQRTEHSRWWV
jgi:hypothetical protein